MTPSTLTAPTSAPLSTPTPQHPDADAILGVVNRAARRVPPLWPLERFVAVNPFLGWTDEDLADAAHGIRGAWGSHLCMPRSFYRSALLDGRILPRHLAAALDRERGRREVRGLPTADLPRDVAALAAAVDEPAPPPRPLPTVASTLGEEGGRDWAGWITDRISAWAGGYFDRGQASWPCPWAHLSPWRAWRAEASLDRTAEVTGIPGFRRTVASLPDDPATALVEMIRELEVGPDALQAYLQRLLADVLGWAAWLRYQVWEAELRARDDGRLQELVAIRLAFEVALLRGLGPEGAAGAWDRGRTELERRSAAGPRPDTGVDLLLQEAWEIAFQEDLLGRLERTEAERAPEKAGRG